jgi:glycosyltransferase involved in cell wall biosynthesis
MRLALLIPARNAEGFIGRLFDSVEAQTEPFDEVLVYDDASHDRTGEVAARRGARVVRSDSNTGPSHGKNALAEITTCEWVHFHDADETLGAEFVSVARAHIRRDQADVVLFGTEDRDFCSGASLGRRVWDDGALGADPVRYAVRETITNCGVYRRQTFLAAGGFDLDETVKYNEDQAMHLRLALAGLRFCSDPYVGVTVYRRSGSMSSAHPIECARAQVDVLARVADQTGRKYAAEIGTRLWHLAGVCGGYSDWEYVRRSLAIAASIGYRDPVAEHWGIRALSRVAPVLAIRGREYLVRSLKPHLRAGYPTATPAPGESGFAADRL